ncbi:MAG: hypothetical protein O7G85_06570 [Planctomycetota bacterium]|nr:hypothetical protein [Planctomycetota bacterium]
MHAGVITSDQTFVIDGDTHCRECRYNLRGLASTSNCPECGHAISLTLTDTIPTFIASLPEEAKRNLRVEVLHQPLGLWITGIPLLVCFSILGLGLLIGAQYGAWGLFFGLTGGITLASLLGHKLFAWRERRAIDTYLSRQCQDRRLNRCPMCYHDLSGDLADICPECGCPVSVRTRA